MIKFVNHDNRISKTTNGVKTDSVWANGGIVNDVVHENGFDVVKTYNDDNTVFSTTVLNLAHTNVTENLVSYNLVNTQGDLAQSVSYKPNGRASSDLKTFRYNAYGIKLFEKTTNINTNAPVISVDTSNPFGYRGYYTDIETGLYYLMARYYDPTTGQFTQEDTYREDNLEYNLYGYCSANPVAFTDPTGKSLAVIGFLLIVGGMFTLSSCSRSGSSSSARRGSANRSSTRTNSTTTRSSPKKTTMKASSKLIDFMCDYEGGYRQYPYYATSTEKAKGIKTIGFGHVIKKGENFDKGISLEKAKQLYLADLKEHEDGVNANIKIGLYQQQFDALVDFSFNLGTNGFKNSSLCKDVNKRAKNSIIKEDLLSWTRQGTKHLIGLYRRRLDEYEMYADGDYKRDYKKAPKGYV